MRPLIAALALLAALSAAANDLTVTSMQSGSTTTPLHDRGLHGQGQLIAILDTGVDWGICYLAEDDGSRPPINTGTPTGGLEWQNIDYGRRKIVAYNFLYSCDQFPGARGCDDPDAPQDFSSTTNAYDNQGHGTHAAATAAGDRGARIVHDSGDSIAPAAKLVVQDAGAIFDGNQLVPDNCTHRPGIGCPVNITPILEQAYRQGVRIHSNSWGDQQGTPSGPFVPTANYSQSARDVDAFVHANPDMLVVFNTGNYLGSDFSPVGQPPASSLSAPGAAKNTIQVGGTRGYEGQRDDVIANYSRIGPTRDGRIKPDLVAPAFVLAGDARVFTKDPSGCTATGANGTSWAAPTIAGAAALVRQYYTEGFYPSGTRSAGSALTPSAALMKATLIAAARRVPGRVTGASRFTTDPVPSYEQGFGFPVLDDVLYFQGDQRRLRVWDVAAAGGLAQGESFTTTVDVRPGTSLKAVLVWTDPPGRATTAADTSPQLVNDLDLRVTAPGGTLHSGNATLTGGQPDRLNNVEVVSVESPDAGKWTITGSASRLGSGPRQGWALVVTGDLVSDPPRRRAAGR